MPNNPINKVVFDGRTLIDLTDTTATADKIKTGYGAYGADGVWMDGTATTGGDNGDVYQDEDGYLVLAPGPGTNVSVTPLSVNHNGTYSAPTGVAYSPVAVNVPGGGPYTLTITGTGSQNDCYVELNNVKYYSSQTVTFYSGESLYMLCRAGSAEANIYIDGTVVDSELEGTAEYNYTLPSHNISISLSYGSVHSISTDFPVIEITENGKTNVSNYYYANVDVDSVVTATAHMVNVGSDNAVWETLCLVNGEIETSIAIPYDDGDGFDVQVVLNDGENVSRLYADNIYGISGNATYEDSILTITGNCEIVYEGYTCVVPHFNMMFYDEDTYTITCDRTFSECVDLFYKYQTSAILTIKYDGFDGESTFGLSGNIIGEDVDNDWIPMSIIYRGYQDESPTYMVEYESDGTITYSIIESKMSYDLIVSGPTVMVPSGYYGLLAAATVSNGSATINGGNALLNPTLAFNSATGVYSVASASISYTASIRSSNFTPGYFSSYTAFTNGTYSVTYQSASAQLPVFAATTWTPSSTNQYISSYRWLTGSQTIAGDVNLVASNIKSGVSIFGVNGTMGGLPSSITYLPETTIVATSFMNKYPLPDLIPFNAMPVDIIINGVVYGPDRQDWIDVTYGNNVYVYKTTSKGDAFATFSFVNRDDAVCSFVENGTYTCKIVYHPFEETEYGNTLVSNRAITGTIDNIGYSYITITCDNTADKATYPYFEVTIGNVTKIIRAQDPYKYQFGNYYIDRFYYYSDSEKTISFWLYGEAESTYNFTITIKGIRKYKDTTSVVNGTGIITEPIGGSYYNVSALEYIKIDRLQEDPLVSRTLTSFTNNNITMVGTGAFYYTTRLESVYLPKVKTISQSAFYYCQALNTVSLPNCSRIDNYAFFSAFSIGASLDLPNLTSMSNYAFGYARLGTINMPLLSSIPSMCFSNCYYLTSFSAPECKFISDAAFRFCSSLTEAVLPKVSHIASHAFGNCYSLSHISAPECSSLGWSVFFSCSNLTQVYIPKVTYIGGSCFYSCSLITSLNFPSCVSIAQGAFTYCSRVTSVSLPLCETLGQSVFSRCYALSSIYLPVCTSIGSYGFANCSSLTNILIPNVSFLGASAFTYCINLSTISILKCSLFYAYTFGYCYNLLSLYLLNSSVTALSNVNAFTSTPISTYTTSTGGVNGSIFVPASLYDAYISATNWATYSSRFVSLTDAEIAALTS